jgi:hypothetical protein
MRRRVSAYRSRGPAPRLGYISYFLGIVLIGVTSTFLQRCRAHSEFEYAVMRRGGDASYRS